jgi:hypothetical protein
MDRHVIKGRGENRGKYLCYARMAPEQTPSKDGFVWLPEQRKSARWEGPGYGDTYAKRTAWAHNGYFVKLIAPKAITRDVVDSLRDDIARFSAGAADVLPCYWFGADFYDASAEFCRPCAKKIVDAEYKKDPARFEDLYGECESDEERYDAAIDGGFDTDHDSPPTCETCEAILSGNLTEYGADEEIGALTTYAAPEFGEVEGWAELSRAIENLSDDDPRWRKIAKVVEAARAAEREKAARQAALSALPGMTEARTALLGVLTARAEQKADEPSYRLWAEMKRFLALSLDKRLRPSKKTAAWERRLFREAESFLSLLGYKAQGDNFRAPYGTYYWPFVVEVEQYRLWKKPAFLAGAQASREFWAMARQGRAKGHGGRDENPHPKGTEERVQWDCGCMSTAVER